MLNTKKNLKEIHSKRGTLTSGVFVKEFQALVKAAMKTRNPELIQAARNATQALRDQRVTDIESREAERKNYAVKKQIYPDDIKFLPKK